ncbi:MAG: glycosyltransferase family 2 protein [Parcubacteria group bacterium]|nr:glycosyltransferase family 2 protein [Parcubacteria group bacterium]
MPYPQISVIIPAYNEEHRISRILEDIARFDHVAETEVIVVDDGSKDATAQTVNTFARRIPLRVLRNAVNRGKGYSVRRGVLSAHGKYCFFADSDNSTPFCEIKTMLESLFEGSCDIVIGSRNMRSDSRMVEQPYYRQMIGKMGGAIIRNTILSEFSDTQCGFKGFCRRAAFDIFSRQRLHRWGFDVEILALALALGYTVTEVPVHWFHVPDSRVRPIKGAFSTLKELALIRWNFFWNVYDVASEKRRRG